jgi:hypothetical protein
MYRTGRKARTEYAVMTRTRRAAEMAVMIIFTGIRKATRPAKKQRRDACRSRDMSKSALVSVEQSAGRPYG